jgi:hypothetical protein
MTAGSVAPVKPNAVPARMAPTIGLVTTPAAIFAMPTHDSSRRRAEEYVVCEHATEREHRLRRAIHPEHRVSDGAARDEHDEAATEVREREPRIDRRQLREIAHQPEQQRGHGSCGAAGAAAAG